MKKTKIKSREVVKKQLYVFCPICKKEIVGTSSEQIDYNLDTHIKQKHPEGKNDK